MQAMSPMSFWSSGNWRSYDLIDSGFLPTCGLLNISLAAQLYRRLQVTMWKKLMNIDRFCIHFRFFRLQVIETSKNLVNIDRYCIYFSFLVLGFLCIKYVGLRSFSYFSSLALSARSCMMCFPLWTSHAYVRKVAFVTWVCTSLISTSWISASHMIHTILFAARVHLEVLLICLLTTQTK